MEETKNRGIKPVDELVFSDDFMFGAVMREPEICKGVLERLLQIKIDHIEYPELQKTISPFYSHKGVRLDVYVADSDKVFDVECQSYKIESIGKRTRYYQSMIDIDSLMKGADYSELKESFIIFICLDDPFDAGLPVYTFERKCREYEKVDLKDETHHVIFNAAAYESEVNAEIKEFLADDKKTLKLEKRAVKLLQKYEDRDEKYEERATKIRRPIGVTLVVIISLLLVVAVGGVTYAVSYFMTEDTKSNAEENNLAINSRTASDTENRINSAVSSVTMFLDLLSNASSQNGGVRAVESLFFDRNKDIVSVYYSRTNDESGENEGLLFSSDAFLVSHDIEKETVLSYMQQESESAEKAKNGTFEVLNATPFFNVPLIALFCPVSSNSGDGYVAFLYSTSEIGESFASGSVNQSFFVNNDGIVLVHSDLEKMNEGTDLSESAIVKEMTELLTLELVDKRLVTNQLVLTVGYDIDNLTNPEISKLYKGEITEDRYGRKIPKHAHGTINLDHNTSSTKIIMEAVTKLYERIMNDKLLVRRINITANNIISENSQNRKKSYEQIDLFKYNFRLSPNFNLPLEQSSKPAL